MGATQTAYKTNTQKKTTNFHFFLSMENDLHSNIQSFQSLSRGQRFGVWGFFQKMINYKISILKTSRGVSHMCA